jgi:glycerophosphoryl diester phosphodiesterase
MAAMAPWPLPLWIAHRGAGKLAPENTLAAFRLAAGLGWRAFECDVKLSADGVPFLLHDDTLDRTTTGHGPAGERPWSELSRLDAGSWHSRAYTGEPIPSLDAVAAYARGQGLALNLELKPAPGQDRATGVAAGAACTRLWPGVAAPVLFSSFRPEALLGARAAASAIPRALLLDRLQPGWWEQAASLGCAAVVVQHRLVDAALVTRMHDSGLRALCYTVNDAAEAQRLLGLGIDGLITDAVAAFAPGPGDSGGRGGGERLP